MMFFSDTTGYSVIVGNNAINVWDLATNKAGNPILLPVLIGDAGEDDGNIYIRAQFGNPMIVIDMATNKIVATITLK